MRIGVLNETIGVFICGNGYGGTVKGESGASNPHSTPPARMRECGWRDG